VQWQVALDLEMPVTTLSTRENQEAVPRGIVVKRLADVYGVPPSYFCVAPSAEMKATDGANAWLQQLRAGMQRKMRLRPLPLTIFLTT
jgi:hypothetical protein